MEESNVLNGTQQTVVESANTNVDTDTGVSGANSVTIDKGANAGVANRAQNKSENHAFAEARRAKEAREATDKSLKRLLSGLNGLGYDGETPDDVLDSIRAKNENKTVDQIRAEKAAQADAVKNDPLYKAMENEVIRGRMEKDLADIQKIDPSVQSLDDLGEDFVRLIAAGISASVAYNAVKNSSANTSKPASTGPIGQSEGETEFFTSKELDRLTPKDLEDPQIFKKAMASLKKL